MLKTLFTKKRQETPTPPVETLYYFGNIKYHADELPGVIACFALGKLPVGLFKYSHGDGYTSTITEPPVEGAEILTMPNYETFAVYKNGKWEIVAQSDNEPNSVAVTSKILPYIAGIHTVMPQCQPSPLATVTE